MARQTTSSAALNVLMALLGMGTLLWVVLALGLTARAARFRVRREAFVLGEGQYRRAEGVERFRGRLRDRRLLQERLRRDPTGHAREAAGGQRRRDTDDVVG